ncbi:MAG: glycosyltransferase family 61 protein [Aquabacterium sp.]|nr:glycosyltransferase family 61 protein [Aquabacterium sp.]
MNMPVLNAASTDESRYGSVPDLSQSVCSLDPLAVGIFKRKLIRSKKIRRFLGLFSKRWSLLALSYFVRLEKLVPYVIIENQPIEGRNLMFVGSGVDVDMPDEPEYFPPVVGIRMVSALVTGGSGLMGLNGDKLVHHDLFVPQQHAMMEEGDCRLLVQPGELVASWVAMDSAPAHLHSAAVFTDAVSVNYAHWLTEVLPRITVFAHCDDFDDVPLLLDAGLHANMYRSLAMSIPGVRPLYLLPKDRQVKIDDAYFVSPAGYIPFGHKGAKQPGHSHGIFSSAAIKLMVDTINNRLPVVHEEKRGRLIYVRRNSSVRVLRNANEIETILIKAGFDVIEPERMSFDEQVGIFRSADVIVGATGAGMANLLFANEGCDIYILIAEHSDMPYYYWQRMADCVDLQISYLLGVQVDNLNRGVHADFEVPIERVHLMLDEMGLSASKPNETKV